MDFVDMLRVGVIAAIPVAIVSAIVILLRADHILAASQGNTGTVGFSGTSAVGWIGMWTLIAVVFGTFAAWVYQFLASRWSWGLPQYLAVAVVLAAVLTVLGFLKVYGGQSHPYAVEWAGLNFAFGIGFGYLIPVLAA